MLRLSIRTKLALLLSGLSLALVAALLVTVKVSFDQGFQAYLGAELARKMEVLSIKLAEDAASPDDLQRLAAHPRRWEHYLHNAIGVPSDGEETRRDEQLRGHSLSQRRWRQEGASVEGAGRESLHRMHPPPLREGPPIWLLDAQLQVMGQGHPRLPEVADLQTFPVRVRDALIGYLGVRAPKPLDNAADAVFAAEQHRLFGLAALVAVLISVLLSWPISRYLVTPVQQLAVAMRALMQRQYEQRVPVNSQDELGELAQAFNLMAQTLGEHDVRQRQWLADISHELRTPLAVLKGELEAMQDGIILPDEPAVGSLVEEVAQLSRLVDDLHQLAVTQATHLRYRLQPLDLGALLTQLTPRLQNLMQAGQLQFHLQLPAQPLWIDADRQRLEQLIMNLAQNSVRYTHPGGEVHCQLQLTDTVILSWEDSAPGVDDSDLGHLFDRFYRVEKSRQRAVAGSGIGLSIVANIAAAHHADVSASHSRLGGLRISLMFPRATRLEPCP